MKKCKMCGSFLSNTTLICPKCGVEVKDEVVENIEVEPIKSEDSITPVSLEINKEESENKVKFCTKCGTKLLSEAKFCPGCGRSLSFEGKAEEIKVEHLNNARSYGENYEREMSSITNEYSKSGNTNLILAIVSLFLCCCGFIAIVPLINSILNLVNMSKLSSDVKNTSEYRSVRNKHIIALIISILVLLYFLGYVLELIINFEDFVEIYNSAYNDALNGNI